MNIEVETRNDNGMETDVAKCRNKMRQKIEGGKSLASKQSGNW